MAGPPERRERAVYGPNATTRAGTPVDGTHEWVSFADPRRSVTWVFDLTFLESNWVCIYGRGCKGVRREGADALEQGCCSYGAHFSCEDDARRVRAAARRLTPSQWQFMDAATELGGPVETPEDAPAKTRKVDDACIFLNRPGFAGGVGCALHIGAVALGERPLDWKPDTCWQLPFRVDQSRAESGHATLTLRQWERGDWGKSGYQFHWWCTEPDAYVGTRPVHEELRDELRAMVGPSMHQRLEGHLAWRRSVGIGLAAGAVRVDLGPTRATERQSATSRATPPGTRSQQQRRRRRR